MKIKVAGIEKESLVDGPGIRYVVFSQGCKHNCIGCHNLETHSFNKGKYIEIDELVEDILRSKHIDGVTFSGGDPFFQSSEFSSLAKRLKNNNIGIISYTGFLYEDILNDENMRGLLENIDILIDGPFIKEEKTLKNAFIGSENQRIIDVKESIREEKVVTLKL